MEDPQKVARAMLVVAAACELAQTRGAFKLNEAPEIAEAVKTIRALVQIKGDDEDTEGDKDAPQNAQETQEAPESPKQRRASARAKGKRPVK